MSDTGASTPLVRTSGQLFGAYVEYMKLMLGNLFVLNAGSATALIAYLGTRTGAAGTTSLIRPEALKHSVIALALGAAFAVAASLSLALSENINAAMIERVALSGGDRTYTTVFGWIGGVAIAASGAAFLVACILAVGQLGG